MGKLWLRAFVILCCKLMLVDVVCGFIADRIVYAVYGSDQKKRKNQVINTGVTKSTLKVIVCGFPRSGSMSLKSALDTLGFPCYHGKHLLEPSQSKMIMRAAKSGSLADWQRVLKGYAAIADYPAACYYKQLMEVYPDAKVILNIRDPERWYKSFSRTLEKLNNRLIVELLCPCYHNCAQVAFHQGILKGASKDKDFAIATYQQSHITEVKEHVPPEKLLVYHVEKEGWASLCDFLQVPIPSVTFPSINNAEAFNKAFGGIITMYGMVLAFYIAFVSYAIHLVLKCLFS